MTISVGDHVPSTTLTKATPDGPDQVGSDDFFKGRTVAVFAVPGAFTPTCSARHLPGFVDKEAELKARGVDEIACTAVNDPFVMAAWAKANDAGAITMLADGNGEFATAMGLTMDGSKFGLGQRSQRYAMLVRDGVVEQLNVEEGGQFAVSSAEHLLSQI
ncbi:peroxiredoxin [Sphingomonas bacterium]|uniref:peroxiredoxin n=1 Tax=Sphingomonas bacterium TaxID=1895847 RepID=UPI0015768313|nr:peroxiredoxin [Sphingomonas bacterium]